MIKNRFFRQKALENYKQNQVPKVMPKFLAPFRIFQFWVVFFLLVGGALALWSYRPFHVEQGTGILRNVVSGMLPKYGLTSHGSNGQTIAILLLPGQLKARLHIGNVVQVQPQGMQQSLVGNIERIDETIQTVDEARMRYQLGNLVFPGSSSWVVVTLIGFEPSHVKMNYEGRRITASVTVQMPDILSLFLTNQKV